MTTPTIADQDDVSEQADACVPIYPHNRWRVFVDLCAYQEDISDLGETSDMTQAAGWALYVIAERLLSALLEASNDDDEDAS